MIAKLLLQNSAFVLAMGALLFASAGTLHWPGAWAFLVTSAVLGPPVDCGSPSQTRRCLPSACG